MIELINDIAVSEDFEGKLFSRMEKKENTIVNAGGKNIGNGKFKVIAGPCSVESKQQIMEIADFVAKNRASFLRGGAFKPRTSPYSFQGLEVEGLKLLHEAKQLTGLPIVTELTSLKYIEDYLKYVDVIQVGARNMQNYDMLKELGKIDKPILLKRGVAATIKEFLMSAEYILAGGNKNIILCERGIRTFSDYTRNTLDIASIPLLKKITHLPVIVDPSHASGIWWLIEPLSLAAKAAGADGIIVEVHNKPEDALSDGDQSVKFEVFEEMMNKLLI